MLPMRQTADSTIPITNPIAWSRTGSAKTIRYTESAACPLGALRIRWAAAGSIQPTVEVLPVRCTAAALVPRLDTFADEGDSRISLSFR